MIGLGSKKALLSGLSGAKGMVRMHNPSSQLVVGGDSPAASLISGLSGQYHVMCLLVGAGSPQEQLVITLQFLRKVSASVAEPSAERPLGPASVSASHLVWVSTQG